MSAKKGLLERLASGPVIGDGGFVIGLEKRGYVKAGAYTPECVVEHPDAVKQYHREFLRAGADVMQAFTFYATENKLEVNEKTHGIKTEVNVKDMNLAACRIAREVAEEGDALVSASLCETPAYKAGKDKHFIQAQYRTQVKYFVQAKVDFIICEFIGCIEEMEWAIEVAKESKLPVAATMCIGPHTDYKGVPTGECGVRMAKAGADIVGINCNFGPDTCLKSVKEMKSALDTAGLHPYLIAQPLAYHTPDVEYMNGYLQLPEAPFAMEPRTVTRFEAAKWARECYEAGIHYIGGCCGFEPYHIRQMSEELAKEKGGRVGKNTQEKGFLMECLKASVTWTNEKTSGEVYWKGVIPCTGRPYSAAMATVDQKKLKAFPDNYK